MQRVRFTRARNGEMGLEQAWALAACVRSLIAEDHDSAGEADDRGGGGYAGAGVWAGRRGTMLVDGLRRLRIEAYAMARMAGHRVLTLVVGRAISGAFLAHGLQSDAIVALAGEGVMMHAMSAKSIARITRRTLAEVEKLAAAVLPMSYAIADAHKLGIIDELIAGRCVGPACGEGCGGGEADAGVAVGEAFAAEPGGERASCVDGCGARGHGVAVGGGRRKTFFEISGA